MASNAAQEASLDGVEATLNYLLDTGKRPWTFAVPPGTPEHGHSYEFEPHQVVIHDARPLADQFALEREGFRFLRHDTAVRDFHDDTEVRALYYPEMEALVKAESGASRVHVFDHTLRTGDEAERTARNIREPVRSVHNDYTEWSAPQRVRDMLPDETEALLAHRFAIIQVWRPIRGPVESAPFAICDGRTVSTDDLVVSERRSATRVGQTYAVRFNPEHCWYWYPRMRRDEAVVFKVFDSLKDGRARWTAHTSFVDPAAGPEAAPRESIEIRIMAFFAP
jgi:hypothetical protein